MRILSMTEFNDFCKSMSFTYIYDTENQQNGDLEDVKIVQRYNRVVCMWNPNRIMFESDQGSFCINRIKRITLREMKYIRSYTLSITCGAQNDSNEDSCHTFVIDKEIK